MNIYHARLLMLAEKLDEVPDDRFCMGEFYNTSEGEFKVLSEAEPNTCGTVACALGWSIEVPEFRTIILNSNDTAYFYWRGVATILFDIPECSTDWDFLFGGVWEHVAGKPADAAMRIRYYVKHRVPSNFASGRREAFEASMEKVRQVSVK